MNAGARHETQASAGAAQLLGALAFQDTAHRSGLHIVRETESLGITRAACVGREHAVYTVTALRGDAHRAIDNLADAVTAPLFHPWEITAAADRIAGAAQPCPVNDALLKTAFRTGLGNKTGHSHAVLAGVSQHTLKAYHAALFTGGNITVSGSGIGHEELVHAVKKTFTATSAGKTAAPAAKYFGGETYLEKDGDNTTVVLAHATAGYAGAAPFKVLAQLLGTGAGVQYGNRHAALPAGSRAAFASFSDAGLLSVTVSAPAASIRDAAARVSGAFASVLAGNFTAEAIARAKNLAMLEVLGASRNLRNGLLATQGKSAEDLAAAIEAVDAAALKKAAVEAARTKRTHVVYGNLWSAPYADQL